MDHIIEWNNETINGIHIYVPGIRFMCKFDMAAGNLLYAINWHIDNNTTITKSFTQTPDDGQSDLTEKDMGDIKYGIYVGIFVFIL